MGLFSIFGKEEMVYFPGCVTYFKYKDNYELYLKIFHRLGINFKMLSKKICCGLPALEAGYEIEARRLARRNFELFSEEEVKSIFSPCPLCHKMLVENYKNYIPDFDIHVKNIWKIILEKLENKPRLIKVKAIDSVTYHDNCSLGRGLGIYDEPRKILELIGYEFKEMQNNKVESFCSGACGGLPRTNLELANSIAKEMILQAKRIGVKKIIVSSFEDYELLNNNINGEDIEIKEFSEILSVALGIKKQEINHNKVQVSNEIFVDDIDRILDDAENLENTEKKIKQSEVKEL
jgi:Fe-S oxidoreductase